MASVLDPHDLDTETFSNGRGWIAVRVTHRPSSLVVERSRTNALRSAVQAQRECIEELQLLMAEGRSADEPTGDSPDEDRPVSRRLVSRSEFDRLAARVAQLEEKQTSK